MSVVFIDSKWKKYLHEATREQEHILKYASFIPVCISHNHSCIYILYYQYRLSVAFGNYFWFSYCFKLYIFIFVWYFIIICNVLQRLKISITFLIAYFQWQNHNFVQFCMRSFINIIHTLCRFAHQYVFGYHLGLYHCLLVHYEVQTLIISVKIAVLCRLLLYWNCTFIQLLILFYNSYKDFSFRTQLMKKFVEVFRRGLVYILVCRWHMNCILHLEGRPFFKSCKSVFHWILK